MNKYLNSSKRHFFRMSVYNPLTKMYENDNGKYSTYAEAIKKQWKCDKCDQSFRNYKQFRNHKIDSHSY
jgi:hypothetical protein